MYRTSFHCRYVALALGLGVLACGEPNGEDLERQLATDARQMAERSGERIVEKVDKGRKHLKV